MLGSASNIYIMPDLNPISTTSISIRNLDAKMAPGHIIFVLACFLVGSSATVSKENGPSEEPTSVLYHSNSAEYDKQFYPSSRNGQRRSYESLFAAGFEERDLDHQVLQSHASKNHHIRQEGLFHDHEADLTFHRFLHAALLLEVSFGDADALLAFKNEIRNYSEGAFDNWTPDNKSEFCSWTGVTCNRQGRVTALHLSSLDLTGSLSRSLCNLSYLEQLWLDQNFLQSEIPPELGQLSRLRVLNLEENRLYGNIPKELGNLTSLQLLNLGSQGSWFNGTIPEELGQLSELRFLNLGRTNSWFLVKNNSTMTTTNKLSGTIPRTLGNCTKLWYLDLYGNGQLTGVIPEELGKLKQLKYLSLRGNNFTGAVPHQLGNLTICKVLLLGNNTLQGHLPVTLANLSGLVWFDVAQNFFTGNLVDVSFTSWSNLSRLWANENSFTGTFPELLLSCSNLVMLDLHFNDFSGNLPADFGRLSSAKFIFIYGNMFGGALPESISNVSLLTQLSLTENKFTGPLDALRNSTLLEYLNLSGLSGLVQNKFTGRLTDAMVRSWPKLWFLGMMNNALMGKLPKALGNMSQLIYLYLDGNKFDGSIPEEFGDLKKLKDLALSDNELKGKIPAGLANMQDVQMINLGGNNLTGSIPRQLGNLTNGLELYFYRNHLTGEIPPELGKLQNLNYLYLDNNNLTSSIPVTLTNCSALIALSLNHNSLGGQLTHINFAVLKSLSYLCVGRNKFSGLFPVKLWNCSNLLMLDMSRNHFSGVLPKFDVSNAQLHQGVNFAGLKILSMASNYFSGSLPSWIWKLPALQVLDLSSNGFVGSLPQDLSGLVTYSRKLQPNPRVKRGWTMYYATELLLRKGSNIVVYIYLLEELALLDVSGNQLTGVLPAELGTLHRLTNLYMADNNFEGSIPAELGELPQLLELDLSGNQLSGPIPVSLSTQRLGYLNLSRNQLCGPIPVTDSFDTRLSGSFLPGNPKLCGDSIHKPCESSAFSCGGDNKLGIVTKREDSWSLYYHGVSMTAFAIGASVGFATVIGMVTLIPAFRNRFLYANHRTM